MELPQETSIHGKWYRDACGASLALEVLGERWSLLIVRELMLGPMRFSAIRAELPGLSAKILTERLAGLEAAGVLRRTTLPPPASVQVYELTQWGLEAAPVLRTLVQWAMRSKLHDPSLPMTATSFVQSLQFSLLPEAAKALEGRTVSLDIGAHSFLARIEGGELLVERREKPSADLHLSAEGANAFLALFYGRMPFTDWLADNPARAIEGEAALARAFVTAFAWSKKIA
ncbi:transcriptional regulator [Altererythrobacter salegens]|uniref:Transcriptional regulator n=1 Tax=Croceibacterium salegens TaxID=1737568 RepID=A0A6I4SW69_9SPHN|nr:helix-turn-helix domain-containing protein [Croceibacterium salegens]MXO60241.1 transcriptional regulator [Croceibacterium salegens]